MATKTLPPAGTTITAALGAPQPAGAVKRSQAPAKTPKPTNFAAWKAELEQAQAITGYNKDTSPIAGMTDSAIFTQIGEDLVKLQDMLTNGATVQKILDWIAAMKTNYVDEAVKRGVAKQIAGQAYHKKS